MTHTPELSYDGRGINGPGQYSSRIATFSSHKTAQKYRLLFKAAPDLLAACNALIKYLDGERPALNDAITNLKQLENAARAAINKATSA